MVPTMLFGAAVVVLFAVSVAASVAATISMTIKPEERL